MSIQTHVNSLSEKRLQIKDQITAEIQRPSPDFETITKLKKQNLALKEEMQRYLIMLNKKTSVSS